MFAAAHVGQEVKSPIVGLGISDLKAAPELVDTPTFNPVSRQGVTILASAVS